MAGIYDERILGAKQQAETARKLREGIVAPQGQMVDGIYVAPSWTQHAANLLKSYSSGKQEREASGKAAELEAQKQAEIATIQGQLGPQQQSIYSDAGPQMPTRMPTEQERMAALLRGASVDPEAFQPQIQMEQWQQGREDKQSQAEMAAALRREQIDAQRQMQAERLQSQQEQARQASADRMAMARMNQEGRRDLAAMLNAPKMQEQQQAAQQRKEQDTISAQTAIDQAASLLSHPGREMATGVSSFMGAIPGTDARGFQAQLETFKAQTFIPMVASLKGMGALSDAEGKKLAAAVGALDPSMPEKEFKSSLENVTRTLVSKANAAGLDVKNPLAESPSKIKRFNPATGRIE